MKTLEDVRDAASFVLEVTENETLERYSGNRLLRQATERNLEIVGEAIGRLSREDPKTASRISERGRIVSFRNLLIHGYDLVDDELVWDTIKNKFPMLLDEVRTLSGELAADGPS